VESQEHPRQIVRFAEFEVDLDSGELSKNGLKVRLPEQPFQFLALLLQCPGKVVTREELKRRLWPDDTFVDFDRSLNTAASKLRDALGDSADSPRYIQTVPKRGYRLIAAVTEPQPAVPLNAPAGSDRRTLSQRVFRRPAVWVWSPIVLLCGAAYVHYWPASPAPPRIVRSIQITNDGFGKSPELGAGRSPNYLHCLQPDLDC
jgi:DNA-binding winged helix-turn-helix (wHTH) protein